MIQRCFDVDSTSESDVVSTLCNADKPTSDFVSFSMLNQRYFNVDPQSCNNVDPTLKCCLVNGWFCRLSLCLLNISRSDQRCFNVVDHRWNNVDPTLTVKQNPASDFQRCIMLIQCRYLTLKQRWINTAQRRYSRMDLQKNR